MRDIPILFSAPMVRALLDGSKTQTRRHLYVLRKFSNSLTFDNRYQPPLLDLDNPQHGPGYSFTLAKGYEVGDRLWVKETIRRDPEPRFYTTDPVRSIYAADGARTKAEAWPWKRAQLNSIHCPRGLSRITLEVTAVRVERLHAISDADAIAEGIERSTVDYEMSAHLLVNRSIHCDKYARLWDSLNGDWEFNPWVRVVTFRRV